MVIEILDIYSMCFYMNFYRKRCASSLMRHNMYVHILHLMYYNYDGLYLSCIKFVNSKCT